MGPKLLFVLGIVLAHGVVAAGLLAQETPHPRKVTITSCVQTPNELPHFEPPRELLAYVDVSYRTDPGRRHP